MSQDNRISHFILDAQKSLFSDAVFDMQMPLKAISDRAGIPYNTLRTYANGQTPLSLEAIKRLLRIEGFGAYLSRLFAPEDHALVGAVDEDDHDSLAADAIDFAAEHARARHPNSPGGVSIVPSEGRKLAAHPLRTRRAA